MKYTQLTEEEKQVVNDKGDLKIKVLVLMDDVLRALYHRLEPNRSSLEDLLSYICI